MRTKTHRNAPTPFLPISGAQRPNAFQAFAMGDLLWKWALQRPYAPTTPRERPKGALTTPLRPVPYMI